MYNGLINVYKEPGFTSFDVVAVLRRILGQKKIGHTGTLDPQAEGVLLVCLGDATKLSDALECKKKEYICRMKLGVSTDTEDMTGTIISTSPVNCTEDEIREAIFSFKGDCMQVPPMYSALKVNGKKMYELARAGITIERKSRPVTFYDMEIINIDLPYVTFRTECSKGTYIRSLCRDIGEKLSCNAAMDHLIRTAVSDYKVEQSLKLSEIEELVKSGRENEVIVSLCDIYKNTQFLHVKEDCSRMIDNGNPMTKECFVEEICEKDGEKFGIYDASGRFAAVYYFNSEKNMFMPDKMFPNNR